MDYSNARVAELYDLANPRAQDADFYLALAGSSTRRILDLGCGTGTLCCAFAECGHHVTGVDPAAAMLAIARRKQHAGRVEWVECAAQSYRSQGCYDLIVMAGHAFQCLLTDDDTLAALETMRLHLAPDGAIAFETRNPRVDWAREWAARPPRMLTSQMSENLRITRADGEFISFETSYRSPNEELTTASTLRFPSRKHVATLIARSGL